MEATFSKTDPLLGQESPIYPASQLTCSLQEAAELTGLSYDYLHGQSKIANPSDRLPGFKTGKSVYRVIVDELPGWLRRKAGIA